MQIWLRSSMLRNTNKQWVLCWRNFAARYECSSGRAYVFVTYIYAFPTVCSAMIRWEWKWYVVGWISYIFARSTTSQIYTRQKHGFLATICANQFHCWDWLVGIGPCFVTFNNLMNLHANLQVWCSLSEFCLRKCHRIVQSIRSSVIPIS